MLGLVTKHKILWFFVDRHHRERYFFICGCKQIVTKPGAKSRREVAERRELAVIPNPRFPFFVRDLHCPLPG
jgi:hypothetical protein